MSIINKIILLFFFLMAPSLSLAQQNSLLRPNFVFILIDDLGWRDIGANGSPYYKTPNMDKIFTEGARFTNAYANAPNCVPSRVAILTGQYPPRTGVYTVMRSERGLSRFRKLIPIKTKPAVDSSILKLPQILSNAGYVNAIVGKAHGHGIEGFHGFFYKPDKPSGKDDNDPKNIFYYTRIAKMFIEKYKNQPFFLYLAHQAVHKPIEARRTTIEKYIKKRKNGWKGHPEYGALIEELDESIGELLNTLENLNLREKTTVILFSDNGGHECCSSMVPLRGAKGTMYEGSLRVPLLISWPGQKKQGQVIETPVSGIDIFPTVIEMAGIDKPDNHILDGSSIIPLLLGNDNLKNRAIYWHFPAYLQEAGHKKTGRWRSTPWSAIRYKNFKLIEFFEDNHLELYDLRKDLGETNNLASTMPEKAEEIHDRLSQWRISVKAPIPTENNPEYNPVLPKHD